MYARDAKLGKKFRHKEYGKLLKAVDLDGEYVFLEESGDVHCYVDLDWYDEVIEVESDKQFYRDCLADLNDIVVQTEQMIANGVDGYTNLYAFRGNLKRLVGKVNAEIDTRLGVD